MYLSLSCPALFVRVRRTVGMERRNAPKPPCPQVVGYEQAYSKFYRLVRQARKVPKTSSIIRLPPLPLDFGTKNNKFNIRSKEPQCTFVVQVADMWNQYLSLQPGLAGSVEIINIPLRPKKGMGVYIDVFKCKKQDIAKRTLTPTEECIICTLPLKNTNVVLPCGHVFHRACVCKWFKTNIAAPSCPLCRSDFYDEIAYYLHV